MKKFRVVINGKIVLFLNSKNYSKIIGISNLYTAITKILHDLEVHKVNGMLNQVDGFIVQVDLEGKSRFTS